MVDDGSNIVSENEGEQYTDNVAVPIEDEVSESYTIATDDLDENKSDNNDFSRRSVSPAPGSLSRLGTRFNKYAAGAHSS